MRKGSIKSTRINSEVAKELSNIIHNEIKDPRIHPMTTVLSADVTPDLKYCKVYVSVLADQDSKKETMEGLKNAKPFIRRALANSVNLRNTPELSFVLDEGIEQGMYLSKLIEQVTEHDREVMENRKDEEEDTFDADSFIAGLEDEEDEDEDL